MVSISYETEDVDKKWCSSCRKKPEEAPGIITIRGNVNCHYCGNSITLCKECWKDLQEKIIILIYYSNNEIPCCFIK
uniref:Uncharacterized protein n=1 Tax=viral metagenome TaxID=1070528 RepID=A0A6M3XR00_9ZZZZ